MRRVRVVVCFFFLQFVVVWFSFCVSSLCVAVCRRGGGA